MADEIQEILRDVAKRIGEFVDNAATMTVETWYVEVGGEGIEVDETGVANFKKNAKPAAQTVVKFDGDSVGVIPMRKADSGDLEVHKELLALHVQNVRTATEYRSSILNSLVGILREYT
jgi:O-phosphoseryl-tRNA(Cys) synthetase